MAIINQPTYLFGAPFAVNGHKNIIPETNDPLLGEASLEQGFPPVTSKKPSEGGINPTRLDFNGILYMLSCFAFFQQSGGVFTWNATLNYSKPALVYHDNVFYQCLADNGPDTTAGAVTPGTNTVYWTDLFSYLKETTVSKKTDIPVGTVISYAAGTLTMPEGWLLCNGQAVDRTTFAELFATIGTTYGGGNGSTTFNVPDYRARFLRGYDGPSALGNTNGERGLALGATQYDGLPNIYGEHGTDDRGGSLANGAFYSALQWNVNTSADGGDHAPWVKFVMDASRCSGIYGNSAFVTPLNMSVNYLIKY